MGDKRSTRVRHSIRSLFLGAACASGAQAIGQQIFDTLKREFMLALLDKAKELVAHVITQIVV